MSDVDPDKGELLFVERSQNLSAQAVEALQLIHELTAPDQIVDPRQTAELVTTLGAAAVYLQRGSEQLGVMPQPLSIVESISPATEVDLATSALEDPADTTPSDSVTPPATYLTHKTLRLLLAA